MKQRQASGGTQAEEPESAPPAVIGTRRLEKLCRNQQVDGLPSQKIHWRQAEILSAKRGHQIAEENHWKTSSKYHRNMLRINIIYRSMYTYQHTIW